MHLEFSPLSGIDFDKVSAEAIHKLPENKDISKSPLRVSEKKHTCPECSASFSNRLTFSQHMLRKVRRCGLCPFTGIASRLRLVSRLSKQLEFIGYYYACTNLK